MKNKKKNKISVLENITPIKALFLHLICGIGLASSFWLAVNVFSINLIDYPSQTLRLLMLIEVPVVILTYSFFRKDMKQSSYLKAVARGLLALPVGAIINALGAIALGAPVGTRYFLRTFNWSLLMSAFTVKDGSEVGRVIDQTDKVFRGRQLRLFLQLPFMVHLGTDWHRIFAQTKLIGSIDYMICLPAHGAVIGAWFGAWPMPLDWERTWQEWPICVTYGAIIGYLLGMLASFGFVVFSASHQRVKGD